MNNSPVCKCAVPLEWRDCRLDGCTKHHQRTICHTCGLPLPKEVKCCFECSKTYSGDKLCGNPSCHCHSPNMAEVTGRMDEFPEGKEAYCPRCYFEDEKYVIKWDKYRTSQGYGARIYRHEYPISNPSKEFEAFALKLGRCILWFFTKKALEQWPLTSG